MPRTGKGGKRQGASQTSYANRTDLNNRGPEPITTAPGQAYGEAEFQREAQRAVPMGASPAAPAPQPQSAATNNGPLPHPEPGTIPFLEPGNSDEPVTAGLSRGAGPGPEALSYVRHNTLAEILGAAAKHPAASNLVKHLAEVARAGKL